MREIVLHYPRRLVFGLKAFETFLQDVLNTPYQHIFVVTIPELQEFLEAKFQPLRKKRKHIIVDTSIRTEPSFQAFEAVLDHARAENVEMVVGIGGGSSMDVAKLVAAQLRNNQSLEEIVGIGKLRGRKTPLMCLPTTSGTGSEVSPNAILLDEKDQLKKGIISPHLMPDASYVDPELTRTVPPSVTAATGMDALIHCIEAYTNKFAHPFIDPLVLEGIRLIGHHLVAAVHDGNNMQARSALALGSLYGGMALGPVNTAAVHVLSYPLGGEFHIPHGVSNAVLLPYVMRFNIPAATERYAKVALALGVPQQSSVEATAMAGVDRVMELIRDCGLPLKLSELRIPQDAIPRLANAAMKVTRLLRNNPRPMQLEDAVAIYQEAF